MRTRKIQTTPLEPATPKRNDQAYLGLMRLFSSIKGIKKVYFEPPPDTKMEYPCVRFHRDSFNSTFADNIPYKVDERYEATLIYPNPDSPLPAYFAKLPMCRHNRHYTANNLSHDVYIIYPQGGIDNG